VLFRHEFKLNHEEWIQKALESSASGVSEHIKAALQTESELVSECLKLRNEARTAMSELLMVFKLFKAEFLCLFSAGFEVTGPEVVVIWPYSCGAVHVFLLIYRTTEF
jgi:hypothetical protein